MFSHMCVIQATMILYSLSIFLASETVATNVGFINTVNYNLEMLNPLRDYTTIKLDLPKQTRPKPRKKRPIKSPKKKIRRPYSKNYNAKPSAKGEMLEAKRKRENHKYTKPTNKSIVPKESNSSLKSKEKPDMFELVKEISKEITNLMQIHQVSTERDQFEESTVENSPERNPAHLQKDKILKKKSTTFSSLIDLGKHSSSNKGNNFSNTSTDNLHNILQDFIEEFKIAKDDFEALAKQITNIAENSEITGENDELTSKKSEKVLFEKLRKVEKSFEDNRNETEKDLFVGKFF